MSVQLSTIQATNGISPALRNNIYSALLSGSGIRNIESTLDEQLRASGFKDALRAYITDLFRSGQATTCEEARELAMQKIREQMRDPNGAANGNASANGEGDEVDLKIPTKAVDGGVKVVMKELEKVCEITYEDDK
jgi:hypothetical protein